MKQYVSQVINKLEEVVKFPKRVPIVLQMEATECGAACLAMILGYYKKWVTLEELRIECGVSRDGSSAEYIMNAAEKYGLIAKAYSCETEDLLSIDYPAIIHWNFEHFVVLEGFFNGKAYLNDPQMGRRAVRMKELEESFTGVLLTFEPGDAFVASGERNSSIKSLAKRFRGVKASLVFLVFVGILLALTAGVIPVFSQIFIDNLLIDNKKEWLMPLLLFALATLIIRGILTWLREKYLQRMEVKLLLSMYSKFFWHILRLPLEFFSQRYTGDIMERMDDNQELANILGGSLSKAVLDLFMATFYLLFMLRYSLELTLIAIVNLVVNLILIKIISDKRAEINYTLQENSGKLSGVSFEGLGAIETIKANGNEQEFFTKWSGLYTKLMNDERKMETSLNTLQILPDFLNAIAVIFVLFVGSNFVIQGDMTMGMLIAFQGLMGYFIEPVMSLAGMVTVIAEVKGQLTRLDDVLEHKIDDVHKEKNNDKEEIKSFNKVIGRVTLQDVVFGYNKMEEPIIEDFNFDVKPGERIAIVGASGSGKSTVAKIITGLYKQWDGEVLFDNIPLGQIDREVLSSSIAYVEQDVCLFEGTIRENLTLWNSAIASEDLIKATKDTLVYDEIISRQRGFETTIEEGGRNFSQGEIQRLEIARGLVSNPTIMILDEATSALDPYTEKVIDENIRRRGCTCIIIAHRLSTIRDCDEIIVLDNGLVVERGTHDDLMSKDGHYKNLISLEFFS